MTPDQIDEMKDKAKRAREAFLRSEDPSRSEKQIQLLMANYVVGWCDCLMVLLEHGGLDLMASDRKG